ncbi:hypothetical protein [Flavobacterium subsaxonicum]|uniref:Uncharacterized protein n=1 Tax=Flavobacterium subsaxonicum WB 4.1-42 = DSM 21790 TaxID=1121898 RepID=A0A0A2MUT5_9FLAO|nr:hypothetical protein [Flavobacterium subsaxonicum]KGO91985.1 hypothetical protein Q766_15190 [Flavobacterium subsaxonicum WB 4.1-42 = DSM 21790]
MINLKKPAGVLLGIFIILILFFVTLTVLDWLGITTIATYGVNKTIGWAIDICSLIFFFNVAAVLAAMLGYGLLSLFKTRVNKAVSGIHLAIVSILLLISIVLHKYDAPCTILIYLGILGIVAFVTNTILAIRYKLSDKKKN